MGKVDVRGPMSTVAMLKNRPKSPFHNRSTFLWGGHLAGGHGHAVFLPQNNQSSSMKDVTIPRLFVGKRHRRVLTVGNINCDALWNSSPAIFAVFDSFLKAEFNTRIIAANVETILFFPALIFDLYINRFRRWLNHNPTQI